MSPLSPLDRDHTRAILDLVASGKRVCQRTLARETGMALGLVNLLVRDMARRRWIRIVRVQPNRMKYLITSAGLAEKDRRTRARLAGSISAYAHARARIAERFDALSAAWPVSANDGGTKRIVFWGAGEEAEVGYVCLDGTDLRLVGVVDSRRDRPFFGLTVSPCEALAPGRLGDVPFDVLVVMSFGDRKPIRRQLAATGYPPDSVFWI